jgi:glucose-1-phosphate cytidylyltransferase
MTKLASAGELAAYKYDGFWQCMDTQRDKWQLEQFVAKGNAPWIVW